MVLRGIQLPPIKNDPLCTCSLHMMPLNTPHLTLPSSINMTTTPYKKYLTPDV